MGNQQVASPPQLQISPLSLRKHLALRHYHTGSALQTSREGLSSTTLPRSCGLRRSGNSGPREAGVQDFICFTFQVMESCPHILQAVLTLCVRSTPEPGRL